MYPDAHFRSYGGPNGGSYMVTCVQFDAKIAVNFNYHTFHLQWVFDTNEPLLPVIRWTNGSWLKAFVSIHH
ncbi:unnamed protein product [Caenorhabditis angaria]|uniref:Uncharacterized protein n=1 Tax=Caenorhabditis angaria TaxID=860376 RepID=A0A9P1J4U8_9PELO|nr:unnamed protein product [Caenorhabditis angaria]